MHPSSTTLSKYDQLRLRDNRAIAIRPNRRRQVTGRLTLGHNAESKLGREIAFMAISPFIVDIHSSTDQAERHKNMIFQPHG